MFYRMSAYISCLCLFHHTLSLFALASIEHGSTKLKREVINVQLWTDAVVSIHINAAKSSKLYTQLLQAILSIEAKTCLTFRIYRKQQRLPQSCILVRQDGTNQCASVVGMQVGHQKLVLNKSCLKEGAPLHELLHSVGLVHEHQRMDRDDHVTILVENIKPAMFTAADFDKVDNRSEVLKVPYNYHSVMHYRKRQPSFAIKSNLDIMRAKNNASLQLGSTSNRLDDLDAQKLNALYKCP